MINPLFFIENYEPQRISYVSLGDSVAGGTIYPGKTIDSFVDYFFDYLRLGSLGTQVYLSRFEQDGDRTNNLITKLTENQSMRNAIKNADIITLSIGGNNLMQAAKDKSSPTGYDWNNINTNIADKGLDDFSNHWISIINIIRSLNPYGKLIVNTIYNPYNTLDNNLHNLVDSYLFRAGGTGINDIIYNNTWLGYSIADIYTSFDAYSNSMGDIIYFYPSAFDIWGIITRNPHPKQAGQQIIFELVKSVYLRY